eukprot:Skav209849  [mRNA]  locus=scaffold980:56695:62829:- [translate_table: standard]
MAVSPARAAGRVQHRPVRRCGKPPVSVLSDDSAADQLQLALSLGVSALVVTVDANAPRHGALHRATAGATGVFPSPSFDWEKLKEMMKDFPAEVPVYLKGIQSAEDALQAVALGVRGIVVSNHGGRACGNAIGALEALQEVAEALRGAGVLAPQAACDIGDPPAPTNHGALASGATPGKWRGRGDRDDFGRRLFTSWSEFP